MGGISPQKSYSYHSSSLCRNRWSGVLTGAEAAFAEMSAGAAVEGGDEQPVEQDLLGLAADAGSRIHHHHLLHLGIAESPLLA